MYFDKNDGIYKYGLNVSMQRSPIITKIDLSHYGYILNPDIATFANTYRQFLQN
ncbi:15076_t:CDS:2, partial [Cetraspora pellucida]